MLFSHQGKKGDLKEVTGGDAYMGNTRKHPEHDGKDVYGRKYYVGNGMGG